MNAERVKQELVKNENLRAEGMRQGMHDLLSLHTSIELRHLCEALTELLHSREESPANLEDLDKPSLIKLIFDRAIAPTPGGYQPVLDAIWDGILIEYLRQAGKNLARCRNKLRGAVVQHWTRNVFTVAKAAAKSTPAYSRAWGRGRAEQTCCQVDKDVVARLDRIKEAEKAMKVAERKVRLCADFPSITTFISNINELREREEGAREFLLKNLEDLLNHRDDCGIRANDSEKEAKRLKGEWKDMKDQLCAKEAMLEYRSKLEWDRIIDRVHLGVRESKLKIQLNKERELGGLEARRYIRVEAHLQQRKTDLERRVAELEICQDEMRAKLRETQEALADERSAHHDAKEAFKTFRERSFRYMKNSLSSQSAGEFKEAFMWDIFLQQTAHHLAEKQRMNQQQRAQEKTREHLEQFLMAANDTLMPSNTLRPASQSSKDKSKGATKQGGSGKRTKSKRGKAPAKARRSQTAKDISLATSSVQSLATESATSSKSKKKRGKKKVRKAKSSRQKGDTTSK